MATNPGPAEAEANPDQIFQIASGFLAAKFLFVADAVGLFESLSDGPMTVEELGQRTGIPRRTIRILADAIVALGLVERTGDRYRNGRLAGSFLGGRTPADLRPFLRLWDRVSYLRWARLEDAIRSDEILFKAFTDEEQKIYTAGVEAVTAGMAQALAATYDFGAHRLVLDLGGGTGSFLIPVLDRYPGVKATLFELPPVAAIARRRVGSSPFAARIQIVEGDFFADSIPGGHDAVIVANILHNLKPDRCLELLRRARDRVSGGARLLLADFWTDPTHTKPSFAALMAGEFLLTPGGGDVYSVEEARQWLEESGWRLLEHKPLTGPASLIVAETAH
jgi:cyclopropane fatty-acyl-phospholipid synthase-like methyltransferase